MDSKITRALLAAARALLCVCCFALLLACFAGGMLRYSLFDRDFYAEDIADEAYCRQIAAFIREDVEDDCYIYQLPFEAVQQQVSEQRVTEYCRAYIVSLYDALCRGQSAAEATFPSDGLYAAVYSYLLGQGFEQEQAQDDARYIAEELALRANENIGVLSGQRLIAFLSENVYSVPLLQGMSDGFWMLLAGALLLMAVQMLFGARRPAVRLYVTGGTLFCAAAVVFVPMWLLRMYDLPSKLVLAHSPLKILFNRFWYTLTDRMFFISLAGVAVAAVVLIAAVMYIVWRNKPAE